MRLWYTTLFLGVIGIFSTAQQFEITGVVKDSLTNEKLHSATVFLESVRDSTLITYSITDENGAFKLIGNTSYNKVNFFTTYQGYKDYSMIFRLKEKRNRELGSIMMNKTVESLDGILITARKAPITVKKDTLEFNAKSFNTKADATLEDVIRELPGVELDKDGKITVNGKEVNQILVNGKEFFGDDPKIALKNLPKEIIDKIQVTESKTDEQKATGEAGDANTSEINITIDEDKNRGWFSRLTAGGGTDDRYSMSGIVNYFNKDFKASVLGSSNNINSPGFSFDEVYDAMGSSAYSVSRSSNGSFGINGVNFGGSGGITSSRSAGLNLTNDWGKKVDAQINYFYGVNDTRSAVDSRRETFLPDNTSFTTESSNNGQRDGDNHRISGKLTIKPDTLTTISIRPNLNISNNFNNSSSRSNSNNSNGTAINDVSTNSRSSSENNRLGANFNFTRKTQEKNTNYGIYGNLSKNENNSVNDFNSITNTLDATTGTTDTDIQDQLIVQNTDNSNISFTPYYRKRLNDDLSLRTNYTIEFRNQENIRNVFDRSSGSNVFDASLSNDFEVKSSQHRPTAGLRYKKGELRIDASAGVIYQTLDSDDALLGTSFDKEFINPSVRVNLNYKFGKFGRVYLNYRNSINIPGVRQLQPVEDRTNPQNIIVGNPDLDAGQNHNIYFNLSKYDWENGSGFYSGGGFTFSENSVAAITTTDANLLRETTYTNVDGEYNGYLYLSYSKSWKKDRRNIGFDVGLNSNLSLNKGFSNAVAFQSETISISPQVTFEYTLKDFIDVELEYEVTSNKTAYNIETINDQDFVNQRASLDITTFWPQNVILGLRGEYNKFGNISGDFDDDSFVLIGSLGYKFANDKATVKLKAYDILDQIINTRRTVSDDFVVDTSSLILQQYFILSFTYKFSKFGGKDPNRNKGF